MGWTVCFRLLGPGEVTGKKELDVGQGLRPMDLGWRPSPWSPDSWGWPCQETKARPVPGPVREGTQVRGPSLGWVLLGDLSQHLG